MSAPASPVDPDLTDLSRRLDDELQTIRRKGWHGFRASDCPLLAQAFPPSDREAPEAPIRRRLLELIDPAPVDARGRTLERPRLETRDPRDRGLLGLIMFGEPGVLTFERDGRRDLIIKPRELSVTYRYKALAELRGHGNTINASTSPSRPRGGAGTELMLDLRDALLPEVAAAARSRTSVEHQPASPATRSRLASIPELLKSNGVQQAGCVAILAACLAAAVLIDISTPTRIVYGIGLLAFGVALLVAPRTRPMALTRLPGIAACYAIVGLAALSTVGAMTGHDSDDPPTLPPGAIVDARNGKALKRLPSYSTTAPSGKSAYWNSQLAGGPLMVACVLPKQGKCRYPDEPHAILARSGDVLRFSIQLSNTSTIPLPWAKIRTTLETESVNGAPLDSRNRKVVTLSITQAGQPHSATTEYPSVPIHVAHITQSSRLGYVVGSSKLLAEGGKVLASLPDSIFGAGVVLAHLGPSRTCFDCNLSSTRYINFEMRVQ